jgi:RimJ/RimL family protein N-acetyltransferase
MQQEENKKTESRLIVFLKGRKIFLRPILKEDLPRFVRWMNDRETAKYLLVFLPMMEADEEEWFDKIHKNKDHEIVLAIALIDSGEIIGSMGLHNISWKDGTAITGTIIGEEKYRNKGYGTEAKMLLLNYAFNTLNLRKICSSVKAFNGRSKKYNEKCGYTVEGVRKAQFFHEGAYCDEIMLAVFKENFLPKWEEYKKSHNFGDDNATDNTAE